MGPRTLESVVNQLSHCASQVAIEKLTVRPKAIISNAWTSHAICETEVFCNISSSHSFYIFCHYFPLAAPDAKPRRAMALSRPLVASSAKSSVGSVSSSVAKAKRRRSPPGRNVDRSDRSRKLSKLCWMVLVYVGVVHVGVVHVGVSPPEIPAPIDPMSVFLHFERPNSVIKASDL